MSSGNSASREEGRGKSAAYIPIDLCAGILCRLSCTDLLKLRHVCKDWLLLISSRKFIEEQMERSKPAASGCNGTRILMRRNGMINEYRYAEGSVTMISKQGFPYSSSDFCFLGSCDGLVACKVYNKIALVNPCTGMTETREHALVSSMDAILCSWFGHHPCTHEYVLFLVRTVVDGRNRPLRLVFNVHSLSGNTCSSISVEQLHGWEYFDSLQRVGTSLQGILFFPAMRKQVGNSVKFFILGYEFESNIVFKMRPPVQRWFSLGVVEGCLTAIHMGAKMFEMWMMKEESWSKYANIEGYDICRLMLTPIASFLNGDVILEDEQFNGTKFSLYNLREMEIIEHCEVDDRAGCSGKSGCVAFMESLVTPAMVWSGNQNYTHTLTHQLGFLKID